VMLLPSPHFVFDGNVRVLRRIVVLGPDSRPPVAGSLAAILARVSCSNVFNSTPVTAEVGGVAQEYRAGALADHGHSILCRFRH